MMNTASTLTTPRIMRQRLFARTQKDEMPFLVDEVIDNEHPTEAADTPQYSYWDYPARRQGYPKGKGLHPVRDGKNSQSPQRENITDPRRGAGSSRGISRTLGRCSSSCPRTAQQPTLGRRVCSKSLHPSTSSEG